jgi:hypothetical protein
MLSIGLWRWYINITITILGIIHRPVFYLKCNVMETGFSLRPEVEPSQLGSIDRAILFLRTPPVRFIKSCFMVKVKISYEI